MKVAPTGQRRVDLRVYTDVLTVHTKRRTNVLDVLTVQTKMKHVAFVVRTVPTKRGLHVLDARTVPLKTKHSVNKQQVRIVRTALKKRKFNAKGVTNL